MMDAIGRFEYKQLFQYLGRPLSAARLSENLCEAGRNLISAPARRPTPMNALALGGQKSVTKSVTKSVRKW